MQKNGDISDLKEENLMFRRSLEANIIKDDEKKVFDNEYKLFKQSILYPNFRTIGYAATFKKSIYQDKIEKELIEKYRYENIITNVIEDTGYMFEFTKKGKYFWEKYITEFIGMNPDKLGLY
ncbi:hypothetical protein [Formosa algae]|uniref:hypothetical protein n=1 Tax=Formosa algae TaxID=225843 RepID=UPI000CCF3C60|nr:hypothetical protein [Formosa algae]PNW28931.1 hypothetical protein BKP44_06735 [Formosa algae]